MIPKDKFSHDQKEEQPAGSPVSGEPVFLMVGKLRRTHGVKGDLLMDLTTDFPERIRPHKVLYVGDSYEPLRVRSVRKANTQVIIGFEGFLNCEDAARLRNQPVYVKASDLPKLPEGEFYHHELIGLKVVTEDGQVLGKLAEILETGANEVYVVRGESSKDLLLPAIEGVILEILLEKGEMLVRPPEWE
jgi:16S rRNA processing protein RimM